MTTNAEAVAAHTPSPSSAERMRLHPKRRKRGLRHVGIMLHVAEIEALIRKGYLEPEQRENTVALETAVCALLHEVLIEAA